MKDLTYFLLEKIVSDMIKVEITETEIEERVFRITAKVPKEEMGRVIGKNGRVIQAVRTLLSARAAKDNTKVLFSLLDEA